MDSLHKISKRFALHRALGTNFTWEYRFVVDDTLHPRHKVFHIAGRRHPGGLFVFPIVLPQVFEPECQSGTSIFKANVDSTRQMPSFLGRW